MAGRVDAPADILFDDEAGDGRGVGAAEAGVLHVDSNSDLGVFLGRKGEKDGMVSVYFPGSSMGIRSIFVLLLDQITDREIYESLPVFLCAFLNLTGFLKGYFK